MEEFVKENFTENTKFYPQIFIFILEVMTPRVELEGFPRHVKMLELFLGLCKKSRNQWKHLILALVFWKLLLV